MSKSSKRTKFKQINLLAIISLFVVILAGGVVRSSGSGMGCPDWPKCFGRYIPPTDVSQLPKDYKQAYVAGRLKKNLRFAKTLDVFGYSNLAKRIREDKSIMVPEDFNAANTWTEYANRLVGVIAGIFLILSVVYSFSYGKDIKAIPVLSIINLILVGFQGWLGSIVVSTNLTSWIVTVHMLLALAILAVSIYTYHLASTYNRQAGKSNGLILIIAVLSLIISVVQIVIGTDVREEVDAVSNHLQGYREDWIKNVGAVFANHRTLAVGVLVINVVLYGLIRKNFNRHSMQQQLMSFTFLMILLQIVTGVILSYWMLPPVAQAAHILLASLVFGAQFYLLLNLQKASGMKGGTI
ncbi:COX15/CtaA family protein [Mucilaginibacter agri]|uniref:Heme A synthase n=1 Tax=Mucilaginibacter agri TaxID=2695265 RepID=A0A965ZIZ6_9SPHI|nr:COX15/CtaA family protein [Mucilaginibacter agri]NCD70521.1 heme A synthase [Mucilaginibacter agri]